MTDGIYTLTLPGFIGSHFADDTLLIGDHATIDRPEVDAKVRSGDYFIFLSTALDTIAAELTEVSPAATSLALAKIAEELEYVQRRYAVIKKASPDQLTELH